MVKVKARDILKRLEVDQMIKLSNNPRDQTMIALLYILGFRISELINLRKAIDFTVYLEDEKKILKVTHKPLKKEVKGGILESRDIYLDLEKLIYKSLIYGYYLKINPGSRLFPISRVHAWRIVKKLNKECWLHLFRHTRATNFADEGMEVRELMQWFDWKSPDMAMKYVQKKPLRGLTEKIK